jgi:putative hydrolase of the HAD superfamily
MELVRMNARDALRAADVVFLDAGFTLLVPARPVATAYAEEARALGVAVSDVEMARAVESAFEENARYGHVTDHRSSEELERAAWRAFTSAAASKIPDLAPRHEAWLDRLFAWFDAPESWRVADEAKAFLDLLRAAGKRAAVISNWHGALHPIAAAHGLTPRLEFVLTSAEAGRRKPHAGIFHEALRRAGVDAAHAVHLGDSAIDDVEGALQAGLAAVLVSPKKPLADLMVARVDGFRELIFEPDEIRRHFPS